MALGTVTVPGIGAVPIAGSGRKSEVDSASVAIDSESKAVFDAIKTAAESANPVTTVNPLKVVSFVPVLSTSPAYTAGDVLFTKVTVALSRANDIGAILSSLTVIDKTKQKPAFTILLFDQDVTAAAANAANALSTADAIKGLGFVRVTAADYIDYANHSIASFKGPTAPNLMLSPMATSTNVTIMGILDAGTPTFALADLMIRFGMIQG